MILRITDGEENKKQAFCTSWSMCFMSFLYSIVKYLYVSCSTAITSVGEESANFSAIVYLSLCGFC